MRVTVWHPDDLHGGPEFCHPTMMVSEQGSDPCLRRCGDEEIEPFRDEGMRCCIGSALWPTEAITEGVRHLEWTVEEGNDDHRCGLRPSWSYMAWVHPSKAFTSEVPPGSETSWSAGELLPKHTWRMDLSGTDGGLWWTQEVLSLQGRTAAPTVGGSAQCQASVSPCGLAHPPKRCLEAACGQWLLTVGVGRLSLFGDWVHQRCFRAPVGWLGWAHITWFLFLLHPSLPVLPFVFIDMHHQFNPTCVVAMSFGGSEMFQ